MNMKTGVVLFQRNTCNNEKKMEATYICFGSPRSGTSMVAGAMVGLGIDMGNDLPVNIEDQDFCFDINNRRGEKKLFINLMIEKITKKGRDKKPWGWKYPQAVEYLPDIMGSIRNPHFIIVYRDPVPALIRASSGLNDKQAEIICLNEMDKCISLFRRNFELAKKWSVPTFLVSYEKALNNPREFVEDLARFCMTIPPNNLNEIVEFMAPGKYKSPPSLPKS